MIAALLSVGLATAALFLISFYFPVVEEIKTELIKKDIDISKIMHFKLPYTILFIIFSTLFNVLAWVVTAPAMFFRPSVFKNTFKESLTEIIMSKVNGTV